MLRVAFLTIFFIGKIRYAPGTFGSLAGVILGYGILYLLQNVISIDGARSTLFTLSVAFSIVAVIEIDKYEALTQTHDHKSIVIDELIGVWIAMAFIGFGWVESILAFGLFRLYDIWKPSIIGRVDRSVKGGLGVVLDDVLAGAMAGISGLIILEVWNKFI